MRKVIFGMLLLTAGLSTGCTTIVSVNLLNNRCSQPIGGLDAYGENATEGGADMALDADVKMIP